MELVKCLLAEGSIRFGEFSRNLGPGAVVDLDEIVGQMPAAHAGDQVVTPSRPVRVRDLLEGRLTSFVPVEPRHASEENNDRAPVMKPRSRGGR